VITFALVLFAGFESVVGEPPLALLVSEPLVTVTVTITLRAGASGG
jgi:hypothetical protein